MTAPQPRLLVIDDDPMQLELVKRWLGLEGFVVETASTAEGVSASVAQFVPDLVLVDVNMPCMSPADVCHFVRTGSSHARLVLFSASDGSLLKALAARLGADGWLSKSAALPEIARQLREVHARAPNEVASP